MDLAIGEGPCRGHVRNQASSWNLGPNFRRGFPDLATHCWLRGNPCRFRHHIARKGFGADFLERGVVSFFRSPVSIDFENHLWIRGN